MIQLHEGSLYWYCGLAIEKEGAIFSFRGGCQNVAQYFAQHKDESIDNGVYSLKLMFSGLGSLRKYTLLARLLYLATDK